MNFPSPFSGIPLSGSALGGPPTSNLSLSGRVLMYS
jgi:hypothetical protein